CAEAEFTWTPLRAPRGLDEYGLSAARVAPYRPGATSARRAARHGAGHRPVRLASPTSLPLAGPLANQAHQQLVLDHVLGEGPCADSYDLAAPASLVWAVTNGQSELVKRFPLAAMRQARPNFGHKLLAALMT